MPGTELVLLGAILKVILDEGLIDAEWLRGHAASHDTLAYELERLDDDAIAATGVPPDDIARAARLYAQADTAGLVYGLDNIAPEIGWDCVVALADLALLTGNVNRPAGGILPMREGANGQGAIDIGCLPGRLPGGGALFDDAHRALVEDAWGTALPTGPGRGVATMLQSAGADINTMLVIGGQRQLLQRPPGRRPDRIRAAGLPDRDGHVPVSRGANRRRRSAPSHLRGKRDGTFTNLERRIQRVRPAIYVRNNDARPEGWVLSQLADRLGIAGISYDDPSAIMDEIASITPNYGGVSHDRLARETTLVMQTGVEAPRPTQLLYTTREERGIQWPCPTADSPSSPILYAGGFPQRPGRTRRALLPGRRDPYGTRPASIVGSGARAIATGPGYFNRRGWRPEPHRAG